MLKMRIILVNDIELTESEKNEYSMTLPIDWGQIIDAHFERDECLYIPYTMPEKIFQFTAENNYIDHYNQKQSTLMLDADFWTMKFTPLMFVEVFSNNGYEAESYPLELSLEEKEQLICSLLWKLLYDKQISG